MSHGNSSVNTVTHCRHEQGIRVMSAPEHSDGAERIEDAPQVLVEATKRIGILGIADLAGHLDRDVGILGERPQLRLKAIGGFAVVPGGHGHMATISLRLG